MPPQARFTASVPADANPFDSSASVAPSVAVAPSMAHVGGLASTVTVDGTSSVTGSSNPRTANANVMQQLFAEQHAFGGSGPFQFVPPIIPETVEEDSAASSSDMSMSFPPRGCGQ
jgi:hypothetical protein